MAGTVLVLSGHVQGPSCQTLAGAMLDFWQANDAGVYDNVGWTLRGRLFTDASGFYQLQTIIPGLYPGRTRHIHVRVSAPGYQLLTTQLYFAGEPANATDAYIRPSLEMTLTDAPGGGKLADFEFVIVPA